MKIKREYLYKSSQDLEKADIFTTTFEDGSCICSCKEFLKVKKCIHNQKEELHDRVMEAYKGYKMYDK